MQAPVASIVVVATLLLLVEAQQVAALPYNLPASHSKPLLPRAATCPLLLPAFYHPADKPAQCGSRHQACDECLEGPRWRLHHQHRQRGWPHGQLCHFGGPSLHTRRPVIAVGGHSMLAQHALHVRMGLSSLLAAGSNRKFAYPR